MIIIYKLRLQFFITALAISLILFVSSAYSNAAYEKLYKTLEEIESISDDLLEYEELQMKYPLYWYVDRFVVVSKKSPCYREPNVPIKKECDPLQNIDSFNDDEVKSLFLHFDDKYLNKDLVVKVMESLRTEKNFKFNHLKGFIYSKKILSRLNKRKNRGVMRCEVFKQIPDDLPYYREMLITYLKDNGHVFRCLSEEDRDDFELYYYGASSSRGTGTPELASKRVQKMWQDYISGKVSIGEFIPGYKVDSVLKKPDKFLTHEELQQKYPIYWYVERFGDVNGGVCDSNEGFDFEKYCELVRHIDSFTNNQIKSLFVNFYKAPYYYDRDGDILVEVLKSLKEDSNSKYKDIKGFIYSKKVLMNLGRVNCGIIQNIPEYLPFYREWALKYIKIQGNLFRCLPAKYRDDFEIFFRAGGLSVLEHASPRVQDLYKKYKNDEIKLEEILPNFDKNKQIR